MAWTRESLTPWWPAVWAVTSGVMVLALLQIESGGFLAASYLVLNAGTALYVRLGVDSFSDRKMTIVGWCVAVQLPVMLWLFTNNRRAPERQHAQELLTESRRSATNPNAEPNPKP